ncbi:MAG: YbhB/YbcL family Raf kinase inhibitor-like protein [Novosphingobium sp.]
MPQALLKLSSLLTASCAAIGLAAAAHAQQGDGTDVSTTIHVFKPDKAPPTADRIAGLKAPVGFAVTPFATGLKNPRMIAVAPGGAIYISRREQGDVVMLRDADGNGVADGPPVVVANRPSAHGLAIHDGKLYIATVKEIFVADMLPTGLLGPLQMIVGDLPDGGQHPNRTIAFGPDGMLYVSVGSTCNACNETNPEHATILRLSPDGKTRTIFARNLRNTIGFGWHPATGELWGMDHGIDDLGDELQPEELNLIEQGKQYGWPHVYGTNGVHPQTTPPGGITKAQWLEASTPMVMGYTAHAAPMALTFYSGGNFPAEYQGDAFVAMRGSWNRKPASGYEIVRIRFRDGKPERFEPFVTGFLADGGLKHIARPVGLARLDDGSLLLSDDGNGTIYRIAYTKGSAAGAMQTPPAGPMLAQANKGVGVPLAMDRPETASARTRLAVRSATIPADGAIPVKHSEYADAVSPALSWDAVPRARSYALIMEDPDSSPIKPFVHWVAWNIPPATTGLPEGLQEQERLTLPEGLMQGHNSRNTPGYFGPQPPVGDPPHRYVFQVLALDRLLDLPVGANRDQVLAAAKDHVLAKGSLTGRYQQLVKPPKSGSPPEEMTDAMPARVE